MPELWAAQAAVNRKLRELHGSAGGANRKLRELWGRDSGGVNRKIFTNAFCSCSLLQASQVSGISTTLSLGSDGSGSLTLANTGGGSKDAGTQIQLLFTLAQAVTSGGTGIEAFRMNNVQYTMTNGSSSTVNMTTALDNGAGGWYSEVGAYDDDQILVGTSTVARNTYGEAITWTKLRVSFNYYSNTIYTGGSCTISWPAGSIYINSQQVNGFLQ